MSSAAGCRMIRRLCTNARFWLLIAVTLVSACNRSEWRELPVNDGAFSILMRGDPQYRRQQVQTPGGKMFAHLYSSDRPDSYFAIGYADYPLSLVVGGSSDQLFSSVRETWLKRIEGKLVASDNTLKLDGTYPGSAFEAVGTVNGTAAFLQARLYLVDQRLYQIVAIGRKDELSQGLINRYMNSFKLIPQSETGVIQIEPKAR
jgi:hypothetical protein